MEPLVAENAGFLETPKPEKVVKSPFDVASGVKKGDEGKEGMMVMESPTPRMKGG